MASTKDIKSELEPRIQKELKGKNVLVRAAEDKIKYSKQQFITIYKAYDFCENMIVVRPYIQRRYNISSRMFSILLKLMGMKIFTQEDYFSLPKSFTHSRWDSILNSGFLNLVADHKQTYKRVYTLNTKARNIVIHFYQCLSGEAKIPEDWINPMANSNTKKAIDKKRMDLIKKINKIPMKEHNKKLLR